MPTLSLPIDDAVAQASSVLRRARLDGLDEAALPFAERHVQAWRSGLADNMNVDTLVNVVKVRGNCSAGSAPHPLSCMQHRARRCAHANGQNVDLILIGTLVACEMGSAFEPASCFGCVLPFPGPTTCTQSIVQASDQCIRVRVGGALPRSRPAAVG